MSTVDDRRSEVLQVEEILQSDGKFLLSSLPEYAEDNGWSRYLNFNTNLIRYTILYAEFSSELGLVSPMEYQSIKANYLLRFQGPR